jgi:hypothetical protein
MEASTGWNFGPATAKKSLGCDTRQFVWELQLKVPAKLSRASEEVSVWQSQKFQYCIRVSTYISQSRSRVSTRYESIGMYHTVLFKGINISRKNWQPLILVLTCQESLLFSKFQKSLSCLALSLGWLLGHYQDYQMTSIISMPNKNLSITLKTWSFSKWL